MREENDDQSGIASALDPRSRECVIDRLVPAAAQTAADAVAPDHKRIWGVDAARALAVIGMVSVHLRPLDTPAEDASIVYAIFTAPYGRASILFVVLAGVGVSLMLGHGSPPSTRRQAALLWRAGVLFIAGLSLQLLDHGVSVILTTYGAMFVLALVLVRLPDRVLAAGAGFFAVTGPVALLMVEEASTYELHQPRLGDGPGTILFALAVNGRYPLLTWMAPLLLGLWLGRRPLADSRIQVRLAATGAALVVVASATARMVEPWAVRQDLPAGLEQLASGMGHSNMPLWLMESIGLACMVIAGCLFVMERERLRRWLWPLSAFGRLALTMYVLHLLLLAWILDPLDEPASAGTGAVILAGFVVVGLGFAIVWRRAFRYGPLESVLRVPSSWGRDRARADASQPRSAFR